MTTDLQLATCPTCQAPNGSGVKFCAQCGTRLVTTEPSVAPPVPPAPDAAHAVPPMTAPAPSPRTDPMQRVRDILSSAAATITGGDGHSTLDFVAAADDKGFGGPMKVYFTGTVSAAPGGSAPYAVSTKILPKSAALMLGMWLIGIVAAGFLPRAVMANDMYIGWIVVSLPVMLWLVFSAAPKRQNRRFERLFNGEPSASAAPTAAAAPGAASTGNDVFAQLAQLAELQATGLLTADEVAAKKADLLKRI